jgi:hypothetical protein
MFEVTDDSGFLALVVPAAYETFVSRNWTLGQIMSHFKKQMASRSLLIWGTGLEGCWNVDVKLVRTKVSGHREVTGPLQVVGQSLLLTNYESLTMAAQFKDVTLPEKHEKDLLIKVADGNYSCRIIQMFDPEKSESAGEGQPDFVIEVVKAAKSQTPWESIPWFNTEK